MRLHHLSLVGFGPFKDEQVIDFDELSSSGLFLIEGATGTGKTTIIDAVVYALFGVASAGDSEATRQRVRSKFCGPDDPTGVACEFSVEGRRFRITRVPTGARDPENITRAAKRQPLQVLTEFVPDGDPIVLVNGQEVTHRISEILGMSVEQFRQLVVLPQGRFAELLRQTPADRLKSLEPLLANEVVAAVQADLEQQGVAAQRAKAEAEARVMAAADQLHGRLAAWLESMPPEVEFTDPDVDDDVRCARVQDILAALQAEEERAQAASDQQADIVDAQRVAARTASEAWHLLESVASATAAVEAARSAVGPEDVDLDEPTARATLTHLVQLTGSLQAHAAWEGQAGARAAAAAELEAELSDLRTVEADLDAEVAPLPEALSGLEDNRSVAQEQAAQAASRSAEVERLTGLRDKAQGLEQAREDVRTLAATVEKAAAALGTAEANERAAEKQLLDHLHDQRAAAAASLAARLVDGEPCPVCGATEHPSPTVPLPGAAAVTDEDIEEAQSRLDAARAATTAAAKKADAAQQAHRVRAQELAALEGALGSMDLAEVTAELSEATTQRDAALAAQAEVTRLDGAITEMRKRLDDIRERRQATQTRITEIGSTLGTLATNEAERGREIAELTGGAGTATEVRAAAQARVDRLQELVSSLATLATSIARVPADVAALAPADVRAAAERRATELADGEALLSNLLGQAATAASIHRDSVPLAAHLRSAIDARVTIVAQTEAPIMLASLVKAGNRYGLQLRSFALQQRFASVLDAASLHLDRMSGGRFSFVPSFERAGGGQSGLGITLMDAWTGQTLDPKALSGGETFYASLALALGLADIVRNEVSGSTLETLFVDEGFGSLDQDTLAQVLDELDALREGNRVVGVVSHVTEMKESIPERIEVRRRTDRTSEIRRDRS